MRGPRVFTWRGAVTPAVRAEAAAATVAAGPAEASAAAKATAAAAKTAKAAAAAAAAAARILVLLVLGEADLERRACGRVGDVGADSLHKASWSFLA